MQFLGGVDEQGINPSILTIVPKTHTGYTKHLKELALLPSLNSAGILIERKDGREVDTLKQYSPELTIIGGSQWIQRNEDRLADIPGGKGILFVGPLGQNEISRTEMKDLQTYMSWLCQNRISYLFTGTMNMCEVLEHEEVYRLPAPQTRDYQHQDHAYVPHNTVSILNDTAPHKNTFNTISGVKRADRVDRLITNGLPAEHKSFIDYVGLSGIHEDKGFLNKDQYYQVMHQSKLLTHVSYSEGFCYAALEALLEGVPCLVSKAMKWFQHPLLTVNNPSDSEEIAERIDTILNLDETEYLELSEDCQRIARENIKRNNDICRDTLSAVTQQTCVIKERR